MHSTSSSIDWLRCALPPKMQPDARRQHYFVLKHIQEAMELALTTPQFATPNLANYFRTQKSLGSKDRKRVQDAVYALIRHQSILTKAEIWGPEHWPHAWMALCEGDSFPSLTTTTPTEDFSCALSLPSSITDEWIKKYTPEQCQELAQQINTHPNTYIRAQNIDRNTLQAELWAAGIFTHIEERSPYALRVEKRANLLAHPCFHKGLFEVQDLSSQQLCTRIASLGNRFLDLCAGSGGKSLALAALGKTIFAQEPRLSARKELIKRAKRAKQNILLQEPSPHSVDVVLIDAPCSGSGRLHRDPALRWRINPEEHVSTQHDLLIQAQQYVAPGGYIVYATCSLFDVENSHTLLGWQLLEQKQISPNNQDGFFWCIWQQ